MAYFKKLENLEILRLTRLKYRNFLNHEVQNLINRNKKYQ